jgi:hypothetical protein
MAASKTVLAPGLSMNKSLAFFGRQALLENLFVLYAQRKHVLLVVIEGIGKAALKMVQWNCAACLPVRGDGESLRSHWAGLFRCGKPDSGSSNRGSASH